MIVKAIKKLINFKALTDPNTYFPGLANKEHKDVFGMKIHFNEKETAACQSIIKHLEVDIFEYKDNVANAFTVPGVGSITDLKSNPHKYNMEGLKYLSKTPLTFRVDPISKQIVFNNDGFKILMFVSSGLIKRIKDPMDRVSIYLHELGHWVYVTDIIRSKSFQAYLVPTEVAFLSSIYYGRMEREYIPFVIAYITRTVLIYLTSIRTMQSEHDADNFVKQCGYGRNLANSLSIMAYNRKLSNLDVSKYYTTFDNILTKIQMLLYVNSHPKPGERIDRLIKENNELSYDNIMELLSDLYNLVKLIKDDISKVGVFNL